jgi:hypothetical protein
MTVTEPGDEVDSWLRHEVEPLAPPPGTFERIHRQARRRKLNQALGAAAAAVVVIAAAVLVPTLGLLPGGSGGPAEASPAVTHTVTVTPTPQSARPSKSVSSAATGLPGTGTGLGGTTPQSNPPPSNFQPTSITMIGLATGAVIGQAGTAGNCAGPKPADCTSLAGTSNYGGSWYGVSAPVTGVPRGSTGTSQLRFLNTQYGWAYGPQLYQTSDSGRTWGSPVPTGGERVTDLEAAGDRAFVVLASCQGSGTAYAANCSGFSLSYLVAGARRLRRITLTTPAGMSATAALGTTGSATLVIRGVAGDPSAGTGYLLAPSGDVFSGSVGGGAWSYAGMAPCTPGAGTASGAPLGAQLTVGGSGLLLNCAVNLPGTAADLQAKQLYQSATGAHWAKVSRPPSAGAARSLAATPGGQVVLATTAGLDYSADGTTWQAASISHTPAGGFSYVGMTSSSQGVALPANPGLGEVFITTDGGLSWSASPIAG